MTKIFKSYSEFLARTDKEMNGVSESFAIDNPYYIKDNSSNTGCFDCSGCSRCFDCFRCFACFNCFRCFDCSGCSGCFDCFRCSGCFDCFRCSDLKNASPMQTEQSGFKVPVIENIHTKVYGAAGQPKALNMSDWHTCDTTHCRAGWVVYLAGEEGKALEQKTSTLFAAMQIYKNSSPIKVSPVRFFESNDQALEDMKKCFTEENKK